MPKKQLLSKSPSKVIEKEPKDDFTFSNIKIDEDDCFEFTKRKKTTKKSLKKLLFEAEQKTSMLHTLVSKGQKKMAAKIKADIKWKSALDRSEGKKVKDDPVLIKRSLKKIQKRKEKSKKSWDDRKKHVEQRIENKQKKRTRNLKIRRDKKKDKKIKILKKRGRIL